MGRIGLVTDSTCDMGPDWLAGHDVVMVPLKVTFGDDTYLDWIELGPEDFFKKLTTSAALPFTSQPSPAEFAAVYERLAEDGCTGIVSVHIAGALSGTIESARMAAKDARVPVRIVDTYRVNAGIGLPLLAAIEARDAGADLDAVEAAAARTVEKTQMYFALDTLEYLVRGGRAGKAQGVAASLLNIKPVLTFNREGHIEPYKKVKGMKKAIAEMAADVAAASKDGKVRIGLLHAQALDLVDELKAALDAAGANYEIAVVAGVGAVIGTHAGPRAIGVAFHPLA